MSSTESVLLMSPRSWEKVSPHSFISFANAFAKPPSMSILPRIQPYSKDLVWRRNGSISSVGTLRVCSLSRHLLPILHKALRSGIRLLPGPFVIFTSLVFAPFFAFCLLPQRSLLGKLKITSTPTSNQSSDAVFDVISQSAKTHSSTSMRLRIATLDFVMFLFTNGTEFRPLIEYSNIIKVSPSKQARLSRRLVHILRSHLESRARGFRKIQYQHLDIELRKFRMIL
ncbi:hypothetical protein IWZ01DRAFT_248 [Phyllosticta capitalensis]